MKRRFPDKEKLKDKIVMEHSTVEIIAIALASSQNTQTPSRSTAHARSLNAKFSPQHIWPSVSKGTHNLFLGKFGERQKITDRKLLLISLESPDFCAAARVNVDLEAAK